MQLLQVKPEYYLECSQSCLKPLVLFGHGHQVWVFFEQHPLLAKT